MPFRERSRRGQGESAKVVGIYDLLLLISIHLLELQLVLNSIVGDDLFGAEVDGTVSQSASLEVQGVVEALTVSPLCLNLLEPTNFASGRRELSVSQSQVRVEGLSVFSPLSSPAVHLPFPVSLLLCLQISTSKHLQKLRGLLCVGLNVLCISPNWETLLKKQLVEEPSPMARLTGYWL